MGLPTRDEMIAVLPPLATSAREARELSTDRCVHWGVGLLSGDVALVVTELVANAVRHAGTDIVLRLVPLADGIRLEVTDGSTRPLRRTVASTQDEGGRGLQLVDALATRYGVEADPAGKRVWAELHQLPERIADGRSDPLGSNVV